eukprot:gene11366-7872_t
MYRFRKNRPAAAASPSSSGPADAQAYAAAPPHGYLPEQQQQQAYGYPMEYSSDPNAVSASPSASYPPPAAVAPYDAAVHHQTADGEDVSDADPHLPPPPNATPLDVLSWCRRVVETCNITPVRSWRRIRFDLPDSPVERFPRRPSSRIVLELEDLKPDDKTVKEYTYEMVHYLIQLLQFHQSRTAITELRVVKKGSDKLQQLVVTIGKDTRVAQAVVETLREAKVPVGYGRPVPPLDAETPNATFHVIDFLQTMHQPAAEGGADGAVGDEPIQEADPTTAAQGSGATGGGISIEDLMLLFAPYRPTRTVDVAVVPSFEPGVFYVPVKRPETVLSFLMNHHCSMELQATLFERYGVLVVMAQCPHEYLLKGVPYHVQKQQRETAEEERRRREQLIRQGNAAGGEEDIRRLLREEEQTLMQSGSEEDDEEQGEERRRKMRRSAPPRWAAAASESVDIFASMLRGKAAAAAPHPSSASSPGVDGSSPSSSLLAHLLAEAEDGGGGEEEEEGLELMRLPGESSSSVSKGPSGAGQQQPQQSLGFAAGGMMVSPGAALPPPPQYNAVVGIPAGGGGGGVIGPAGQWGGGAGPLLPPPPPVGYGPFPAPPPPPLPPQEPVVPSHLRQSALRDVLADVGDLDEEEEEEQDEDEGKVATRRRQNAAHRDDSRKAPRGPQRRQEAAMLRSPRLGPNANGAAPSANTNGNVGEPHLENPVSSVMGGYYNAAWSNAQLPWHDGAPQGGSFGPLWQGGGGGGGGILGAPPSPQQGSRAGDGGSVLGGPAMPSSVQGTAVAPLPITTSAAQHTPANEGDVSSSSMPLQRAPPPTRPPPPPASGLTRCDAECLVTRLEETLAPAFAATPYLRQVWARRGQIGSGSEGERTSAAPPRRSTGDAGATHEKGGGEATEIPSDASSWLNDVSPTSRLPPLHPSADDDRRTPPTPAAALQAFLELCDAECAALQALLLLAVPEKNATATEVRSEAAEEAEAAGLRECRQRLVQLLLLAPPLSDRATHDWVPVDITKAEAGEEKAKETVKGEGEEEHSRTTTSGAGDAPSPVRLLPAVFPYLLQQRQHLDQPSSLSVDETDAAAAAAAGGTPPPCVVSKFGTTLVLQLALSLQAEVPADRLEIAAAERRRETTALATLLARFLPPLLFRCPTPAMMRICAASLSAYEALPAAGAAGESSRTTTTTTTTTKTTLPESSAARTPHPLVCHVLAQWDVLIRWLQRYTAAIEEEAASASTNAGKGEGAGVGGGDGAAAPVPESDATRRLRLRLTSTVCNALDRLLAAISAKDRLACRHFSQQCHVFDAFFHPPSSTGTGSDAEEKKDGGESSSSIAQQLWGPRGALPLSVLRLYLNADIVPGMPLALEVLVTQPPPPAASAPKKETEDGRGEAEGPRVITRDHYRFFLAALSRSYVSPVLSKETAVFAGVFLRALEIHSNRLKEEAKQQQQQQQQGPLVSSGAGGSSKSGALGKEEEVFFLAAAVRALPPGPPPTAALPIYLSMRQSYFDLSVFSHLCASWGLGLQEADTEKPSTADPEEEESEPQQQQQQQQQPKRILYRRAVLEEGHPAVQRLLNARKVPTAADVQSLFPTSNTSTAPASSTTTTTTTTTTGPPATGSSSHVPRWDPAWTEVMKKYPKVGQPFRPVPSTYTVELSRTYGFYYYKPKSTSRVHASPTYKHPLTGEEFMATPQAFLRHPSVTTTLKDLVQYAIAQRLGGHHTVLSMREAEAWFHDQRMRHPLLDAAVMLKLKISYRMRSSSSSSGGGGGNIGEKGGERAGESRGDGRGPHASSSAAPSSRGANIDASASTSAVDGSGRDGRRGGAVGTGRLDMEWRQRRAGGDGLSDAALAYLLRVTAEYPAAPEAYPFPDLPRGWTVHLSTINGLYMFRSAVPPSSVGGGVMAGGYHQHPTTRLVYRVTPQAFGKHRRVNLAKLREVAQQLLQARARPLEAAAAAGLQIDADEEQAWWADQRVRHPLFDRAMVKMLKVDYENGEEQIQHKYGKPSHRGSAGGARDTADRGNGRKRERSSSNSSSSSSGGEGGSAETSEGKSGGSRHRHHHSRSGGGDGKWGVFRLMAAFFALKMRILRKRPIWRCTRVTRSGEDECITKKEERRSISATFVVSLTPRVSLSLSLQIEWQRYGIEYQIWIFFFCRLLLLLGLQLGARTLQRSVSLFFLRKRHRQDGNILIFLLRLTCLFIPFSLKGKAGFHTRSHTLLLLLLLLLVDSVVLLHSMPSQHRHRKGSGAAVAAAPAPPALRWVLFDGVYYPALRMDPSDAQAGVEVPPGSAFVYFLDGESVSVVPESDVLPYDPHDTAKARHPDAVRGVELAAALMEQHRKEVAAANHSGDDATLGDLLGLEDGAVGQSALKKKSRGGVKLEESDDNEASATPRRRRQRAEQEEEDDALLSRVTPKKEEEGRRSRKARERRRPLLDSGSDDDDDPPSANEDQRGGEEEGEEERWRQLGADVGMDTPPLRPRGRAAGREGKSGTAFSYAAASAAMGMRHQSAVAPYVGRIRYVMDKFLQDAEAHGMVLNLSVYQVVEAIEKQLLASEAKAMFLEQCLEQERRELEHAAAVQGTSTLDHASDQDDDPPPSTSLRSFRAHQLHGSIREIERTLDLLRGEVRVEEMVREMVQLVPTPQLRAAPARPRGASQRQAPEAAEDAFVDPVVEGSYRLAVYPIALPESAGQEKIVLYHEQRRRLQQQASAGVSRLGFGKSGLYRPGSDVRVLDQWSRSKALLAIAPVQEAQLIKPSGFYAAKHSSSKMKMEAYALRRLQSRLGASSSNSTAEGSGADDLLQRYRQQTGQRGRAAPALYGFHDQRSAGLATSSTTGSVGGGGFTAMGDPVANLMHNGVGNADEMRYDVGAGGGAAAMLASISAGGGDALASLPPPVVGTAASPLLPPLDLPGENAEALLQLDEEQLKREREAAALQSMAYSASVALPSQDSVFHSEADDEEGREKEDARRGHPHHPSSTAASPPSRPTTWRDGAKRAILEQLTLYYKGLKGRPQVLDATAFQQVAMRLLDRVTRAESERLQISLTLEVHNRATKFTKELEKKLKKSVDTYVQRHFIGATSSHHTEATVDHRGVGVLPTAPAFGQKGSNQEEPDTLQQPAPATALDIQADEQPSSLHVVTHTSVWVWCWLGDNLLICFKCVCVCVRVCQRLFLPYFVGDVAPHILQLLTVSYPDHLSTALYNTPHTDIEAKPLQMCVSVADVRWLCFVLFRILSLPC